MSLLTILTTNQEKQAQARAVFADSHIELSFAELETPEIQAYTCEEVASASAAYAYQELRCPLAVTDAGFFIKALNGFPGPFLKFVNTMLSTQDMLRMMEGKTDREIRLVETIVYIDERRDPKTFSSTILGELAHEPRGEGRLFDQLFIPIGQHKTAAELGLKKMSQIYLDQFTHWKSLRKFLEEKRRLR